MAAARLEHVGEGVVARLIIFADVLKTDIAHGKPPLHPQAGSKNKCLLLFLCCPKKNAGRKAARGRAVKTKSDICFYYMQRKKRCQAKAAKKRLILILVKMA